MGHGASWMGRPAKGRSEYFQVCILDRCRWCKSDYLEVYRCAKSVYVQVVD
jgi:hypothetical protein